MQKNASIYSISKTAYSHATLFLTAKQVKSIFRAAEKAYEHDIPLNRFFTIHFNDHVNVYRPQDFMNRLMGNARKWLRRRNIEVAYLYVLENAPIKGIHVHLMIHIPNGEQVAFKAAMKNWLPFEWTRTSVNVKRISYPPYGSLSVLNLIYGRLRYICKGIHPEQVIYGIEPKFQGEIYGKRYGISRHLKGCT